MLARLSGLGPALKRHGIDCYNVTLTAGGYCFSSWDTETTLRPKLEAIGCTELSFSEDFEHGGPVTYVMFMPPSDLESR